jgi:plastocyanin
MKHEWGTLIAAAALAFTATHSVIAAPVTLTIKNHKFAPAEIHVRANAPSEFLIVNQDASVEEFDSVSLKVEKVVSGNDQGTVRIRPLAPGKYPFMGEFHSDTAQGVVVAE